VTGSEQGGSPHSGGSGAIVGGGLACVAVFLIVNAIATAMIENMLLVDASRDTLLAICSLAMPGILGGLAVGWFAGKKALTVGVGTGLAMGAVGLIRPYWQIGAVSNHAAHSGLLHYMEGSPIVILTFVALGSWIGGEVRAGRITLDDPPGTTMPGLED
jgi:hypothetical protein